MEQNKQLILIIEDEDVNRRIIKNILKDAYDFVEAENGEAGLAICKERGKELAAILLDLSMPVMDGNQFLTAIKGTPYAALPVLVMTGSSDEITEQTVLQAGAWDFIPKPYNPTILHIRLANAIAKSKMASYEQVKFLSEHDPLTGLFNRGKLFAATREMIRRAPNRDYVFICMDIDRFGLYNSSFGEAAGDKLLLYFSDMLRAQAADFGECTYGRFGNDVFCICVAGEYTKNELRAKIQTAQDHLSQYSKDYVLKLSAGACFFRGNEAEGDNLSEVHLRASLAGRRCKKQFDKVIEFSSGEARRRLDEEVAITNEMESALAQNQFVVYFQPKYEVQDNRPCGSEALVRWQHPQKGLISPGLFIPVFERNGFIAKLDYYVWEHTCRRLRSWLDAKGNVSPVSVNVSRVSLYNAHLDRVLRELVDRYKIPTELFELEITESAYMTSPDLMREMVDKLHTAGFKVLMDDFGSDYSSLNSLKSIDVDILKLDMAFVPKDTAIEKSEIILASIIKMAKWLGTPVIVEGVETKRQRDFLEGAGCEMIQGYYYDKPLAPQEFEKKYIFAPPGPKSEQEKILKPFLEAGTVLIIDDSEMNCDMLKSYFVESYNIEISYSAEDALVFLRRNPDAVKLILVDNIMPGMSGLDFMRFCQQDNALCAIPKVMITASDSVEDHLAAFQLGAYDFITKPFVKEIVIARVRHIMETAYHYTNYDRVKMEYEKEAFRDVQTGLLCGDSFKELGNRMLSTFPEDPMALLRINMDNFAAVNDACGYETGTEILRRVAAELKKTFRRCDAVARTGGDDFSVLLCGIPDKKTATTKGNEVSSLVSFLGAREYGIFLSASIGLVYPVKADTVDTILEKANMALHEAKISRKGICVIYGESVPPVEEGGKPIVLVCGGDYQTFKEVALAYGNSVGFLFISEYEELTRCFEHYGPRIAAVLVDVNTRVSEHRDEFYRYLRTHGSETELPMLAICKLGNMAQLQIAIERKICDLLPLPIQPEQLQAQLSMAIMRHKKQCGQDKK